MDYRLDYKQLLVELPIPLSNSKQLRFIMNKKNIFLNQPQIWILKTIKEKESRWIYLDS